MTRLERKSEQTHITERVELFPLWCFALRVLTKRFRTSRQLANVFSEETQKNKIQTRFDVIRGLTSFSFNLTDGYTQLWKFWCQKFVTLEVRNWQCPTTFVPIVCMVSPFHKRDKVQCPLLLFLKRSERKPWATCNTEIVYEELWKSRHRTCMTQRKESLPALVPQRAFCSVDKICRDSEGLKCAFVRSTPDEA